MNPLLTPLTPTDPLAPPKSLAERLPLWALLMLGTLLTALTANRWGVSLFAWLAPVPFLLAMRRGHGWRFQALVLLAIGVGTGLQVGKIVTPPISFLMVPAFSVPAAMTMWVGLLLVERTRRKLGEGWAIATLASFCAVNDWVTYATSFMGAWGTSANTQLGALPLLQFSSLFGLAGIGFLMGWVQGALALAFASPAPMRHWRQFAAVSLALAAVLTYGSFRVFATQQQTVNVAAVVSDLGVDPANLPDAAARLRNHEQLFERTRLAAQRGARLVVWNEAATLLEPAEEKAFVERARQEARQLGVDLVLAYAVITTRSPLLFDNKFAFLSDAGEVLQVYRKHHPVPGEPSMKGDEPLETLDRPYGRVAGAICYDFDFPALTRAHALQGAEIFVVPASDWRGIDPFHTEMARVRAIEGGFSVIRPVRWAASAGFDAYGRIRGWMPYFEENERVLVTTLPVRQVPTLYTRIGDWPVLLPGLFLLLVGGLLLRVRKAG